MLTTELESCLGVLDLAQNANELYLANFFNSNLDTRQTLDWPRTVVNLYSACPIDQISVAREFMFALSAVPVAESPCVCKEDVDSSGLWWAYGHVATHPMSTRGIAG